MGKTLNNTYIIYPKAPNGNAKIVDRDPRTTPTQSQGGGKSFFSATVVPGSSKCVSHHGQTTSLVDLACRYGMLSIYDFQMNNPSQLDNMYYTAVKIMFFWNWKTTLAEAFGPLSESAHQC